MRTSGKIILGGIGVLVACCVLVMVIVTSDTGAGLKNDDGSTPNLEPATDLPTEPCALLLGTNTVADMEITNTYSQGCQWETSGRNLKVVVFGSGANVDELFELNGCPQQTTAGIELCTIGETMYGRSSSGLITLEVLSGSLSEDDKAEVTTRFTAALS